MFCAVTALNFFCAGTAYPVDLMNTIPGPVDQSVLPRNSRSAQEFTTTASGYIITNIQVLGYRLSSDQNVSVKIYSSDGGIPGAAVATAFTGSAVSLGFWDNFSIRSAAMISNLSISLSPATTYWLVVENLSGSNMWIGRGSGNDRSTKLAAGLTGNDWATEPFDYAEKVTAVPEPSTLFLLGISVLVLGSAACRRKMLRIYQ